MELNQNNVLKKRDAIESHNLAEKTTQYTDAGKLDINENIEKLAINLASSIQDPKDENK